MGTNFIGHLSAPKAGRSLKIRAQAAPEDLVRRIYQQVPGSGVATASPHMSMSISEEPEGSDSAATPSAGGRARARERKAEPRNPGEEPDDGVWESTDLATLHE